MMSDKSGQQDSTIGRASIYEVLHQLSTEIEDSIKLLSDESKYILDEEIKAMREMSYAQRSPEAEYVARLFKKYAEIASSKHNKQQGSANKDIIFGNVQVPCLLYTSPSPRD